MNRAIALLVAAAVTLGACSTTTTTPSVSATPPAAAATILPSPTPDVAKLFLGQIATATKASLTTTGTLEIGAQLGDISGSLTYVGGDTNQTTTITIAGVASTTANVHVAGVGYTKVGDGPWFKDLTPPATGSDLAALLKGLSSFVDKGVEQHDGKAAHRIELAAGTTIPAAAFGLTDPAMVNPTVAIVFYAADDGKPLAMVVTVTWTQAVNGATIPVKMTLDLTFTQIGGSLTVQVPLHVWNRFTSTRYHYKLSYPDEWDVITTYKGYDLFDSPISATIVAARTKVSGVTLNSLAKATISYNKTHYHWTFNTNVSTKLGGVAARLITYHATISGVKVVIYEVVALKGGYAYDLGWSSDKGAEAADLVLFMEILATFGFA
jgi:hypothetical protein